MHYIKPVILYRDTYLLSGYWDYHIEEGVMDRERSTHETDDRNAHNISRGKSEGKPPLGKTWRSSEDNIKMDVGVIRNPILFTHIMLI